VRALSGKLADVLANVSGGRHLRIIPVCDVHIAGAFCARELTRRRAPSADLPDPGSGVGHAVMGFLVMVDPSGVTTMQDYADFCRQVTVACFHRRRDYP
jgi:hypothetical protein